MRNQFIQLLCTWQEKMKLLLSLNCRSGFSVLEPFSQEFPKRFINVGKAEQNILELQRAYH